MHTWTLGKYHNEGGTILVLFSLLVMLCHRIKSSGTKVHCLYVGVKSYAVFLKSEKQLFGGVFPTRGIVGSIRDLRNP